MLAAREHSPLTLISNKLRFCGYLGTIWEASNLQGQRENSKDDTEKKSRLQANNGKNTEEKHISSAKINAGRQ